METKKPFDSVDRDVEKIRRYRPIERLFLLDVLQDHDSRPAIFWALGTLLLGTMAYHWMEGWSFLDSMYFCVVSLATVGYGDYTPTTPVSKVFTMVYLVNGIAILVALFDRIRTVRTQRMERLVERQQEG
jgi:hypothetical protein